SYSVGPSAVAWVRSDQRPGQLLGEGARLTTEPFLSALAESYDRFALVHLTGDPARLYERSKARAESLGLRPHNWSWWKGRVTASGRLAGRFDAVAVNAFDPTPSQVAQVLLLI